MKEIRLTQGVSAIVDDDIYEYLSSWKWQAEKTNYGYRAFRTQKTGFIKKKKIYMHREILKISDDLQVDHINHNTLDNRACNLRAATRKQNTQNRTRKNNTGYKGVKYVNGKFQARIGTDPNRIIIGYFRTAREAAIEYNKKAIELYGDFACLNELQEAQ